MTQPPLSLPPAMPLFDSLVYLEAGNGQVNQYLANLSLSDAPDAGLVYELAVRLAAGATQQRKQLQNLSQRADHLFALVL